ncbi:MAG: TrkA family potassium uptake protein [Oscillospiraceae bacterium]
MNILLVGGRQNTTYLLKSLKADGHEVVVVNKDYDICQMLANEYEVVAICGDGTSTAILKQANADKMDTVIALCDLDADNLIICEIAKKSYNVRYTYALVNNSKSVEVFDKLGVDSCINPSSLLKQLIDQQAIENSISKFFHIKNKEVVVREIQVSKKSSSVNKKLWEIGFPPHSSVISIFRGHEAIIPQGNTELLSGDKVLIIASSKVLNKVIELLNDKKKEHALL